ncbi:MAG: hypothetical protein MH252_15150 [Thermosynechococcaceae cyanobacterium MS004]|nr:hypothetical protein [Thermosynechococcaceae cyanobacterium MS004]
MLNALLGWIVGFGSLGFYLAGFLLPEVRRKNDAIWSGIGILYALTLLTNGDATAGLLLGQIASATLIGWFGWQILQQRRALTSDAPLTTIPNSVQDVFPFLKQGWGRLVKTYSSSEPRSESGSDLGSNPDSEDILAIGVKALLAALGSDGTSSGAEIDLPDRFNVETTAETTQVSVDSAPVDLVPAITADSNPDEDDAWGEDLPSVSPEIPADSAVEPHPSTPESTDLPEAELPEAELSEAELPEAELSEAEQPEEAESLSDRAPEPVESGSEVGETLVSDVVSETIPPESPDAPSIPEEAIAPSSSEPDTIVESSTEHSPHPSEHSDHKVDQGEEEDWPPKDETI